MDKRFQNKFISGIYDSEVIVGYVFHTGKGGIWMVAIVTESGETLHVYPEKIDIMNLLNLGG
ncbi:hypothetical protein KAR91_28125 [Candidatus Pacearchaeota archaeon]|nr:hypothetical protein [Candidatus Pacearchaeota archaeon]